jgi:hypothetical protein
VLKVATSVGEFGTVAGVQLSASPQKKFGGFDPPVQVALPAKLLLAVESRSVRMAAAQTRKAHAGERWDDGIFLPWKDLHDRSDCVIFIATYLQVVRTSLSFAVSLREEDEVALPETPNKLNRRRMLARRRSIVNRGLSLNFAGLDPR